MQKIRNIKVLIYNKRTLLFIIEKLLRGENISEKYFVEDNYDNMKLCHL